MITSPLLPCTPSSPYGPVAIGYTYAQISIDKHHGQKGEGH